MTTRHTGAKIRL